MANLFSVKDKVTVITGGTGVLGRAVCSHLAQEGAKVVVLGRNSEAGNTLVASITADAGEAMFLKSDVMDADILRSNRDEIVAKYGRIDALINAAGGNMPGAIIPPDGSFFDFKLEDFGTVLDINLKGTILSTQIFLEQMVEQKHGAIVNFSSMSSFRPLTRVLGYSAAKAAVNNFTQFIAAEIAKKHGDGIRINAIAPGFFLTEQNRTLLSNADGSLTQRAQSIIAHTPFSRFGRAEEVAGTIQYLISDASTFVTGSVVVVDGGFNAFSI